MSRTASSCKLMSVEETVEEFRNGRMVILADDEERENEGDLVIPAQMATPEAINFMARYGRGLICLALSDERVRDLGLELMPKRNESRHDTAFTVSIEAREGITTGISASDRARTIAVAIDPRCGPDDLTSPGHVFPLVARDGGVLVRTGHTEASVDLARLAGLNPAAVICEIMNDDGTMARMPDLEAFSQRHNVKIATIADLIAYRLRHDSIIRRVRETTLTSHHGGTFRMYVYADTVQKAEHIALVKGDVWDNEPVPVRAHAFNILDDGLADTASENTGKLQAALRMIGELGRGVVVVIREPFPVRLSEPAAPDAEHEDSEGLRDYGVAAQILLDLGVRDMDPASQTRTGPSSGSTAMGSGWSISARSRIGHGAHGWSAAMAEERRVLILEARFYEDIADQLVAGAIGAFDEAGVGPRADQRARRLRAAGGARHGDRQRTLRRLRRARLRDPGRDQSLRACLRRERPRARHARRAPP